MKRGNWRMIAPAALLLLGACANAGSDVSGGGGYDDAVPNPVSRGAYHIGQLTSPDLAPEVFDHCDADPFVAKGSANENGVTYDMSGGQHCEAAALRRPGMHREVTPGAFQAQPPGPQPLQ